MRSSLPDATPADDAGRSLAEIAAAISHHHAEANRHAWSALDHARQAGQLLTEAKAQVPHGGWLAWMRDHCAVSPRTAQDYMRIAAHWSAISASGDAPMTIDGAVKCIADAKRSKNAESAYLPAPAPKPESQLAVIVEPAIESAPDAESLTAEERDRRIVEMAHQLAADDPEAFYRLAWKVGHAVIDKVLAQQTANGDRYSDELAELSRLARDAKSLLRKAYGSGDWSIIDGPYYLKLMQIDAMAKYLDHRRQMDKAAN